MKKIRTARVKSRSVMPNSNSNDYGSTLGHLTRRQERALCALVESPRSREEIDRITGASNGPEVISQLRKLGIAIECHMVPHLDRDGLPGRHGIYSLSKAADKHLELWK